MSEGTPEFPITTPTEASNGFLAGLSATINRNAGKLDLASMAVIAPVAIWKTHQFVQDPNVWNGAVAMAAWGYVALKGGKMVLENRLQR